ncbi:hypothetical protein E2C01_063433 [Portunus trituberculatus]|uniref:Uncharacterized protein n=1 Tax=Portunus trituberculatus TaxID=210409 RepID=A0A5B7HH10_PORTR|nr:hypothetical protein [Portunus trituberculatus]
MVEVMEQFQVPGNTWNHVYYLELLGSTWEHLYIQLVRTNYLSPNSSSPLLVVVVVVVAVVVVVTVRCFILRVSFYWFTASCLMGPHCSSLST